MNAMISLCKMLGMSMTSPNIHAAGYYVQNALTSHEKAGALVFDLVLTKEPPEIECRCDTI